MKKYNIYYTYWYCYDKEDHLIDGKIFKSMPDLISYLILIGNLQFISYANPYNAQLYEVQINSKIENEIIYYTKYDYYDCYTFIKTDFNHVKFTKLSKEQHEKCKKYLIIQ